MVEGSTGLMDKVSVMQHRDCGFKPHKCYGHDPSYDTMRSQRNNTPPEDYKANALTNELSGQIQNIAEINFIKS